MYVKTLFCMLLLAVTASVSAECVYPQRVDVPSGKTATKAEMIEGQKTVKAYLAEAENYLACMEQKHAAAESDDPAIEQERKALWTKRHNAMVEEMQAVGDEFNVAVRAFKARDSAE